MKILVQPFSHTLSHISRPLLIAKELRNRGHEVLFAGESPKVKFIQQEGFEVIPIFEPDPIILYGNIRRGKMRFIDDDDLEKMISADLSILNIEKPDLVLTDGRFSAPISTQLAGIKHAAIVNVSSTEYRALPYIPLFEGIPSWMIKRQSALWKRIDHLNLQLEMFIFDNSMNTFKRLSRKFGLKKNITATNCLAGNDITLLPDVPEYFPTRNLPENYHYIGPLTWRSDMPPPGWWPPQKNGQPLIYVTMGTTGVEDFFHKANELFKMSEMTALITTGSQAPSMKSLDGKIYVEEFMDGDLAMEACDLVVCHGGNGTIYQALQHGKPIIGIPTIPDQKFNMRRIETLGLGKALSWEDFATNPSILLDLIRAVSKDKAFCRNALIFKRLLEAYDSVANSADIIEKIAK